jgi:hypothetical protein
MPMKYHHPPNWAGGADHSKSLDAAPAWPHKNLSNGVDVALSAATSSLPHNSLSRVALPTAFVGPDASAYYNETITTGIVLNNPATQNPATLAAGGYITNTTTVHNGDAVYGTTAGAWDFINYGTIKGKGANSSGIDLLAGGSVTNGAGGAISGAYRGVFIGGGAGTLSNSGVIRGTGAYGVGAYLGGGGTVVNGATISGVLVGVFATGGAGFVTNSGTVQGTGKYGAGIYLQDGGAVANLSTSAAALISGGDSGVKILGGAGTVTNSGTIRGSGTYGDGVYLGAGGSVGNAQGGLIEGAARGVAMLGSVGTVANYGTITGGGIAGAGTFAYPAGVYLQGAGTIVNGASNAPTPLIAGVNFGIVMAGSSGLVSNYGTIAGGIGSLGSHVYPVGIYVEGQGVVVNGAANATTALISGVNYGIEMATGAAGTVTNFGTIASTASENLATYVYPVGIYLQGSGTVINGAPSASSALISGARAGVKLGGTAGTVSNFGTIRGTGAYTGEGIYLYAGGRIRNARQHRQHGRQSRHDFCRRRECRGLFDRRLHDRRRAGRQRRAKRDRGTDSRCLARHRYEGRRRCRHRAEFRYGQRQPLRRGWRLCRRRGAAGQWRTDFHCGTSLRRSCRRRHCGRQ